MENITENSNDKKIKFDISGSRYATGRRKKSIARVWVKKGSGNIIVNGKKINNYFKRPTHQLIVQRPLEVSNVFDIPVDISRIRSTMSNGNAPLHSLI